MGKQLSDLNHTIVPLSRGGEVFVLDTGAVIDAEATAMLQALHSRSDSGIHGHLEVLAKKGPEKFMSKYYVGYNHKSIGDCGTTTIFIEGVSMLAAKAIQDNPLYSGQEASTRYIDFSSQAFIDPTKLAIDPTGTGRGHELLEAQRSFYMAALEPTKELLREKHPWQEGERKGEYRKAIEARSFDICRGLLPMGASTNLAWHTNLRQASDKILFLRHHPLAEVREIADGLEEALKKHHPNSFHHKRYEHTEEYQDLIAEHYYFHDTSSPQVPELDVNMIDAERLAAAMSLIRARPEKTELPKYLGQIGQVGARFRLDGGSFRDVQRHRAITQRMPLLTTELGFNSFYRDSLPQAQQEALTAHLKAVESGIDGLGLSKYDAQYFVPMGYDMSNQFTGDLPATVYMIELRDTRFVHPTLQRVARSLGNQLTDALGIPLHIDPEANRFDVRRGAQDIVLKED